MHSLRHFICRHQVGAFFMLALVLSWLAFIPYAMAEDGIPWFTFGPTAAAILMATLAGGWAALKALLASVVRWRAGPVWYLVALGLPFLIQVVAVGLNPLFGAPPPNWSAIPPLAQVLPMVALFAVFSGPLGEEVGWRGFAMPRLLERHSALIASLIVGAVWAVWHLPLILVDDFTSYGALMPVIAAVVFTWVFQNSRGSVLLAILMHVSHQNSVRYLGRVYIEADQVQQQWIGVGLWVLAVLTILAVYGTRTFAKALVSRFVLGRREII
jgi:membrane protease YdiL (CAAX protease family)